MKKITQLKALLAAAVMAVAGSQNAQATLFFTDQFNYPDNVNLGSVTGPWNTVTAGGGDNNAQLKVTTASAQTSPGGYATAAFNGVAVAPAASQKKTFAQFNGATGVPATAGNVAYASFLVNVQTLPASGSLAVAFMHNTSANSGWAVAILVSSTGQIGVSKRGGTIAYAPGTPFATPGTHLVVMRYTFITGGSSNDEVAVWVDPSGYGVDPEPAASASTIAGSDFANPILIVGFNSANVAAGPVFWFDEVRVGTTWSETVPSSGGCTLPTINTQPTAQTNCAGQQVQYSVAATGTTLTYQWRTNGVNLSDGGAISGATTDTLTINPIVTDDAASAGAGYDCVVTESATCSITTTRVALGVNTAPAISDQPDNASAAVGASANFIVAATGGGLAYQWEISTNAGVNWNYVNGGIGVDSGSDGNGGTTASFTTVTTTAPMDQYQYRCQVSGTCSPATTSDPATLTVTACDPAGVTDPANQSVTSPATAIFTVVGSGSAPTYQWYYSTDNWVTTSNLISSATNASYTTPATTGSMNGREYRCVVSVGCGGGSIASSAPALLTVNCASLLITSDPTNRTVFTPSTANFVVAASGSPTLSYQWYSSTDNWVTTSNLIGGATSASYTTPATTASDDGTQFRCVVTSSCDASVVTSAAATLSVLDPSVISYRSVASGDWLSLATWEFSTNNGGAWLPAVVTPTSANCTNILISSATTVTVANADVTLDDTVVAAGGNLTIGANRKITITTNTAAGTGLSVFGTVEVTSSSGSALTLTTNATVVVGSGGVLVENGTSSGWISAGAGSSITFAPGGKFQLVKTGGRIPLATWQAGSTCEIAYTENGSRPDTAYLSQNFAHFTVNCPLNTSGWDFAGTFTNVQGDLTVTLGASLGAVEFKLFSGAANSGNLNIGGNLTMNSGRLNVASSGGPWTITLTSNLFIGTGASMDLSGSAGQSYTLILNGTDTQNYTCDGVNIATKLNWTVNSGSTLNLNSDLALTQGGRTLTADGTVNLNGRTLSTDLLAGSGTVRNQGGGSGLLVLGGGNGANTLGTVPSLVNGTSGTLGLGKSGSGLLTITDPQTFGGGLVVSNGTVLVNNISGSGTGGGNVTVVDGTLGGNGTIAGLVNVESAGNLAPGNSIDDLTINGVLTLGGTFTAEVNTGSAPNTDQAVGTSAVNYGGTLEIVNQGSALTASDTFQIFPAGTRSGLFAGFVPVNPDNNAGLAWNTSTLTTDGTLRISTVAVGPDTTPTNIVSSVSGGNLTLTWPSSHIGWTLQAQTNSRSVGLSNNWTVYDGGYATTNEAVIPIEKTSPTVFFRLFYQIP